MGVRTKFYIEKHSIQKKVMELYNMGEMQSMFDLYSLRDLNQPSHMLSHVL